jgi:hypothetical protein
MDCSTLAASTRKTIWKQQFWPWSTGVNSQPANVSSGGIWPGGPGNPLTLITNLAGSFPGAVLPASPWTGNSYYNSPDYVNPRSQQWNFDIQRQFGSMALVVAYVGSKTTRLDYTGYANAAPTPKSDRHTVSRN